MPSTKQEIKDVQNSLKELRPDGDPWQLVQDWTELPQTSDPVVEEQIWKHNKTNEKMKNQRAKPRA